MSPKVSRATGEPDKAGLPPGHLPMGLPVRREAKPKKPIPLWWKIGGYVVLLAATVGTIVYLGRPVDPRSSARGTAELVAKALNDGDFSAYQSYLCGGIPRLPETLTDSGAKTITTVLTVTEEEDDHSKAYLRSRGFRIYLELTLLLVDQDGSWCVSGVA